MTPRQQALDLRQQMLPQLSARKADLHRILHDGPSGPDDYKLLVSALAFTLAEVSIWEAEQTFPKPPEN